MGCFLVLTDNDFKLLDVMSTVNPEKYGEFTIVSQVNNPQTQQVEVLIDTTQKLGEYLRGFFPESRPSAQVQRHHIFPIKNESFFKEKTNINIDDALVPLDRRSHIQMTNNGEGYKNAWDNFINEVNQVMPNGTKEEITQLCIREAGQLITAFGFGVADVTKKHG